MKRFNSTLFNGKNTALFFAATALICTGQLGAQTDAVSNLGEAFSGSFVYVGYSNPNVRQLVFSFTTGSTAASFNLSGVSLNFAAAGGSTNGLTVGLYSSVTTGTLLGTAGSYSSDGTVLGLIESAPMATLNPFGSVLPTQTGLVTFSGSATLVQNTTYYLKLLATPTADGLYNEKLAATFNQTGLTGWLIGDKSYIKENGGWMVNGGAVYGFDFTPSFSVQASAIPEPSTYAAIAGAAMLGLAAWRRRSRKNSPSVATV
jgi:hypothetical protein